MKKKFLVRIRLARPGPGQKARKMKRLRLSIVAQFLLKRESLRSRSMARETMRCKVARVDAGPRTYEIRLKCPVAEQPALLAGLQRYGKNRIIDHGLVNFATVTGFGDTAYFVVTDGRTNTNAYRDWKNRMKTVTCLNLRKLPEVAQVEWIRPFTRFSQRRFGWGDAQATKEEVVVAVREENYAELLAIMPEATPQVQRGELQQLPALFDAMRSGLPAALADCRHQFLTESMCTPRVLGPCGACSKVESDSYRQGFTRCPTCGSVRCKPCAAGTTTEQDQQQSLLRAYHDVKGLHTWAASKDDCDLCGAGPCGCGSKHCDECRAGVQTKQCDCGVVRCAKCLHVHAWTDPAVAVDATAGASTQAEAGILLALPPAPQQLAPTPSSQPQAAVPPALPVTGCTLCGRASRKVCSCGEARCEACFLVMGSSLLETRYEVHPNHHPAECYVANGQMEDTVKLEWLVHELGDEAGLGVFARKYHELFGEKIGVDSQKAKCLKLYRQYASIAKREDLERGPYPTVAEARKKLYSMECQVPPDELEEFQRVWDADAPRRCHENQCELPADAPLGQHFCSAEHAQASKKVFCTRVVHRQEVDGEEVVTYCSGNVVYRNGCRVCKTCGQGSDVAKIVARSQKPTVETEADKSQKRSAQSLLIANNVWGRFASRADPEYVPAWTKKRRL